MISHSFSLILVSISCFLSDVVSGAAIPAPDVVVFAAPTVNQAQPGMGMSGKQLGYPGGGYGGGYGGGPYGGGGYGGVGPGGVGAYGELEYDDGFNTGYGYGTRTGSQRTAYANYLAYYGIGLYPGANGGLGRSACLQRCRQNLRPNCALVCRSYG